MLVNTQTEKSRKKVTDNFTKPLKIFREIKKYLKQVLKFPEFFHSNTFKNFSFLILQTNTMPMIRMKKQYFLSS